MGNNPTQAELLSSLKAMILSKEAGTADTASDIPTAGGEKKVLSGGASSSGQEDPLVKRDLPAEGTGTTSPVPNDPISDRVVPFRKKPAITDDAYAKEAGSAGIANDLLASIAAYTQENKQASAAVDPSEHAEGNKPVAKIVEQNKSVEGGEPPKEDDSNVNTNVGGSAEVKQATNASLVLSQDVLLKVASAVLSTQEGTDFAEKALAKEAGAEEARMHMGLLQKQAAFNDGVEAFHAIANTVAQTAQTDAAADFQKGAEAFHKIAGALVTAEKQAQAMPPEAMGPEAMGPEAMGPEAMGPEAGGEASPEEIIEAIIMMAQSGQIAPEEAEQIIAMIEQAGAVGAAPQEAAPTQEGAEAGMEVTANARDFQTRLAGAVNYLRSIKK